MSSDKLVLVALDVPVLDVPFLDTHGYATSRESNHKTLSMSISFSEILVLTLTSSVDLCCMFWHTLTSRRAITFQQAFFPWVFGPTILYDLELYLKHLGLDQSLILVKWREMWSSDCLQMLSHVSCSFCVEKAKWIQRPQPKRNECNRPINSFVNSSVNRSSCSAMRCLKANSSLWFVYSSMTLDSWRQQSSTHDQERPFCSMRNGGVLQRACCAMTPSSFSYHFLPNDGDLLWTQLM